MVKVPVLGNDHLQALRKTVVQFDFLGTALQLSLLRASIVSAAIPGGFLKTPSFPLLAIF